MRYLAAYLLAVLGGNQSPDESTVKKILSAGDVNVDDEKLSKLFKDLEGKNIEEILEEGKKKLTSVPSGGAATAAPTTGTTGETTTAPAEDTGAVSEEDVWLLSIFIYYTFLLLLYRKEWELISLEMISKCRKILIKLYLINLQKFFYFLFFQSCHMII